jgi:hypothetical protein
MDQLISTVEVIGRLHSLDVRLGSVVFLGCVGRGHVGFILVACLLLLYV